MELVLDERMQRLEALNSLMGSSGMAVFMEEFKNLQIGAQSQIDSLECASVDQSKLAKLNYELGKKKAYQIVLEVLDSFREELEERNSPSAA